jgi:hypothetical protein
MTPGREVAGVVDEVGAGVEDGLLSRFVVVDLGAASGGYAQLAVAPREALHDVPDGKDADPGFLPPVLLFLFRLVTLERKLTQAVRILDDGLIILNVVAFPLILALLSRLLAPECFALRTRRLQIASILMVATVAVSAYLAGRYSYRLLTCHDFVITGADPPTNCRQSGHP